MISSKSFDKALKIRWRSGLEENFCAAHSTGFNNMMRSSFRIADNKKNSVSENHVRSKFPFRGQGYLTAIMLISTFTNLGNADTCTVSLAGKLVLKYFPYT